jgi:hypothetical protein
MDDATARRIKNKHGPGLMKQAGVHGVGLGQDEAGAPRLVILVDAKCDTSTLPKDCEGLPVTVEASGPVKKQRGDA